MPRPSPSMAETSERSSTTIRVYLCEVTASRNLKAASLWTSLSSHSMIAISPIFSEWTLSILFSRHTFVGLRLSGFPVSEHIAQLREAMNESHMRHLSRFRYHLFRIASVNDREMDVIVDVNVFYFDLQARWISANSTSGKLKIVHHCRTSSVLRNSYISRTLRTLPSKTEVCSNFETSADTPAERASCSVEDSLCALYMMIGTSGITRFSSRVASRPFITDIERSRRIRSGCNA